MAWTLDKVKAERQRAEKIQPRTSVSQAQVDAAAQATMTQNKGALQPGTLMGSLMDKATGVSTVSRQNIINPRKVEVQKPGVWDERSDDRLAELYAQLESTPATYDLNDNTRYRLKQEIVQLEQQKEAFQKSEAERLQAEDWEKRQAESISKTGDAELMADLQRLRELEAVNNRWGGTQKEYNALLKELRGKYGENLDEWRSYVDRTENRAEATQMQEELSAKAKDKPFWMSAATLPTNMVGGLGFVDVAGQKLQRALTGSDVPIDYNTQSMRPAQITNTIRGSVSEKIEEDTAGKFGSDTALGNVYSGIYKLGMSMGDSAIGAATGTSLFMAGSAASNAMLEAKERGATDAQAILFGLVSGAAEGAMEKISIDNLLKNEAPDTLRHYVKNIAKQGLKEVPEEIATNVSNTVADAIIMGDKSQLNQMKYSFIENGYSPEEAEKMALKEWGKSLATDAIGALISGGTMEAVHGGFGYIGNNIQNQKQRNKPIDNTWTPEQKANLDKWLDDWMQEGREPAAAPKEDVVANMAQDLSGNNSAQETAAPETETASPFNDAWQSFMDKHKGEPRVSDYVEFARSLGEDADVNAFMDFLEQQEQEGKLKWRSDGAPGRAMPAEDHIDNRDYGSVGDPKVKSFQYNNPELKPFIREGLKILGEDLERSNPGERYYNGIDPNGVGSQGVWSGQKRHTTPEIAELKDTYKMSWGDINKAYNDLMEDAGKENNANAKRLELLVDDILTNGHRTLGGNEFAPNQEYIDAKSKIDGYSPKQKPASGIDENFMRHEFGDGEVGDMGAKTSAFKHDVVKSQSNSIDNREDFFHVPADKRTEYQHTVVTEKESLHNARLRLDQDYEGEQAQLIRETTWTGEQVDESRMISDDLLNEAMETNSEEAWQEYQDWRKVMRQHDEELGRGLQALAKYARKTGNKIIELASDALENAREGTNNVAVLNTVADYAKQYDAAVGAKDVDGLVQIIKNTAKTRQTGTFRKNNLPKEIGWALDRIAELAKADLAKPKDANTQQEKPKPVQNYTLKSGDRVTVSDRNNIGTITAVNEDGTYTVHFKAKSGAEATKKFSGDMVTKLGQSKTAVSAPAKTYEVGRFYDFLENFAAAGIEAIASDKQKASFGEQFKTYRFNSMLSKASTFFRNLGGNGIFGQVDSAARNISVPLDMLVSKLTGTRSVAGDKGMFSKTTWTGSKDALAMALLETGLDVNSDGAGSKYENSANRTNKMTGGPIERLMSNWEKWMGYALTATDEFAKGGVSAEVQRNIDALYEQGKIKDDSLRDAGDQEAKYRTFQDDTRLSKGFQTIRSGMNEIASIGGIGAGDIVMPFVQVPTNVISRSLEYSPVGLAKSTADMCNVLVKAKNGKLTAAEQAKAVQGIGRGITGSGLIAIATAAALKGLIHVDNPGDTDENKDKAAMDKTSGLSGTQLNVSALMRWANGEGTTIRDEDTMISIGFLEPINSMLITGALIAEDIEAGDATAGTVLLDSLEGTVQALGDLPVMQTVQSFSNALQYSKKETVGGKLVDAGLQTLADQTTSIIPNAIKGIAQGLDPYQRDLYTGETLGEKTVDAWKASIPGLRNTLPVKYDSFGNPMMNEGGVQNFLNTNILPGQVTTYKTNDTIEQLRDLEERTGKASVYPGSKAPKTITVDNETVQLTQEQKDQFQQHRGKLEEENRAALFANETYAKLTDEMELKAHGFAEDFANQMAKAELGVGYEPESWVSDLANATPEEIGEAMVQKAVESIVKSKAYSNKYDGISQVLEDGIITEGAAAEFLSEKQKTGYFDFIQGSNIEMDDYLDVIEYYNGDGIKQEDVKAYIEKGFVNDRDRCRVWQCFYSKNTIPDEWQ